MFVLRYKLGTSKRLWHPLSHSYVNVDIGGRYYCSKPSAEWGYSTDDLSLAKVFTRDKELGATYFSDTEKVDVRVELV